MLHDMRHGLVAYGKHRPRKPQAKAAWCTSGGEITSGDRNRVHQIARVWLRSGSNLLRGEIAESHPEQALGCGERRATPRIPKALPDHLAIDEATKLVTGGTAVLAPSPGDGFTGCCGSKTPRSHAVMSPRRFPPVVKGKKGCQRFHCAGSEVC